MSSKIIAVKLLVTLKCRDALYLKGTIIKGDIPKVLLREIEADSGYVEVFEEMEEIEEEVEETVPAKKKKIPLKKKL